MKYVLLTLFTLLTACTPNTMNGQKIDNAPSIQKPKAVNKQNQPLTAKDIIQPKNKIATPDEIAHCQKQGGTISKQGMAQYDFCVVEFADKGKVCTDGNQCQSGRCLADGMANMSDTGKQKGICARDNVPFGCYGTINNGQLNGFLCVD